MSRRASSFAFLMLAVVVAACGGGRAITGKQLATIMPSAADAPSGTQLRTEQSGPKILDEFVAAEDVRTKLRGLGFVEAWVAQFTSPGFPGNPAQAKPGALLYATFAVLLRDADAAHAGFVFYRSRSRARAEDLTPILAQGFGDDSFVFHFSILDNIPLPGIAYLWRVDNALFSVVVVGNPGPDAQGARTIARTIDTRAKR